MHEIHAQVVRPQSTPVFFLFQLAPKYSRFIFVLFLVFYTQYLLADDLIPLKVVINSQDKGEYFVLLTDNHDVLVREEDFKTFGINLTYLALDVDGDKYISLSKLNNQLGYNVDERNLSLRINIDPAILDKTFVDLSQKALIPNNPFGIDSAFLNYSVITAGSNNESIRAINTPLEGVISAHDMLLELNFNYSRGFTNGVLTKAEWSRGMASLTRDFPKKLNRLVVGDVRANSGELGGAGIFLGLSFGKKFSMARYFTKYPSVSVNGLLRTPSTVNMYVNNVLVRSEILPPGEFSISNLPNLYGAGSLEMETIDAFGRVTRNVIPFYVSTNLLRAGLHDFLYTVGLQRITPLNAPRAEYSAKPTFLGFHRYGVTRYFTLGFRFEYSDELKNIGSSANILIGSLGEIEVGLSASESTFNNNELAEDDIDVIDTQSGIARYFRYGFTSRYFHGRYAYRQRSIYYNTVGNFGVAGGINTDAIQAIGVGVHGLRIGSISLGYDLIGSFSQPKNQVYSLIYSVRIARQASLLARATQTKDALGIIQNSFIVSISAALGRNYTANVSRAEDDENKRTSTYAQKSVPVGTGFGGRLSFERNEAADGTVKNLGSGNLVVKTKYFSAIGDYALGEEENAYNSQVAGSLAFIDNDFYFTRPILDSFGLAKVDNLDDVGVFYGSERVGSTTNGRLIIPNLISYADNYISIDGQDVPVDRSLKNTQRRVSPRYRTGSVAIFEVDRFQGFFGYIFLQKNAVRKTADFASIKLQKDQQVFNSVIGKGGEFYIENLNAGSYRVEIKLEGEICKLIIKIPDSNEMMVELGDYVCQM